MKNYIHTFWIIQISLHCVNVSFWSFEVLGEKTVVSPGYDGFPTADCLCAWTVVPTSPESPASQSFPSSHSLLQHISLCVYTNILLAVFFFFESVNTNAFLFTSIWFVKASFLFLAVSVIHDDEGHGKCIWYLILFLWAILEYPCISEKGKMLGNTDENQSHLSSVTVFYAFWEKMERNSEEGR